MIMPSCDAGDALGLASRLTERLREFEFEPAGHMTVSIGVSQGPQHAMNPRELVACAEAAMMTAKARGKNQTSCSTTTAPTERPAPTAVTTARDVRSIAHLKMLQSLAGKLNRLNDVRQIGDTIATELRLLIDYHNCRVVLRDGDDLVPIAFVGDHDPNVALGRRRVHARRSARASPAARSRPARRCSCRTRSSASSRSASPAPTSSRSRSPPCRCATARASPARSSSRSSAPTSSTRTTCACSRCSPARRRRARERAPLRAAAPRGRGREGAARLRRRALAGVVVRRDLPADRRDRVLALRDRAGVALDRRRVRRSRRRAARGRRLRVARRRATACAAASCSTSRRSTRIASRLLASFAYQASVALQKARLYWKQLEAAEIANALLDASRELATAESPEEVLGRSAEVTARVLGTRRAALWIEEEAEPRDLVARASFGYTREDDPAGRRRFSERARARTGSSAPTRSSSSPRTSRRYRSPRRWASRVSSSRRSSSRATALPR